MDTRTELVMLQKTMVVVEGVARSLDPQLNIWDASEPVVRTWIERHLGPVGRLEEAGRGLKTLSHLLGNLPEMALRTERLLAKFERAADEGFSLERESVDQLGRAQTRVFRWIALPLWLIVILMACLAMRGF
jgi:ubiquinone biosynthesis protein